MPDPHGQLIRTRAPDLGLNVLGLRAAPVFLSHDETGQFIDEVLRNSSKFIVGYAL